QFAADVIVRRQFVPRRADLIGMRGGQNLERGRVRDFLPEHVEPHVAPLTEHLAIADRPVRLDAENALAVDRFVHRFDPHPVPFLGRYYSRLCSPRQSLGITFSLSGSWNCHTT